MSNAWNEPGGGPQNGGDNPWTRSEWELDRSERTAPTDTGWGAGAAPVGKKRAGALTVMVAVIGVLLIAIAGVAAYLLFVPGGGSGNNSIGASDNDVMPSIVTESIATQEDEAKPESSESLPVEAENDEPSVTTREVRPATSPGGNREGAPDIEIVLPESARSAGLNLAGWSDNTATRCRSGEELIYAGKGADAWVTVCSSGSGMTYRSDVFGGTLTSAVDIGQSNPAQGNFVVPVAPSTIRLIGDVVRVYQDGVEVSAEALPNAWVLY